MNRRKEYLDRINKIKHKREYKKFKKLNGITNQYIRYMKCKSKNNKYIPYSTPSIKFIIQPISMEEGIEIMKFFDSLGKDQIEYWEVCGSIIVVACSKHIEEKLKTLPPWR